jgi:hypothetical protein
MGIQTVICAHRGHVLRFSDAHWRLHLVWYGEVRSGCVRYGPVRRGRVWQCGAVFGEVRSGVVRYGMDLLVLFEHTFGPVWCGMAGITSYGFR